VPRYNPRARERGKQVARTRIVATFRRRWREMHDGVRAGVEPPERAAVVEVRDERHDAVLAQSPHVVGIAREADHPQPSAQQICDAQRDIPATDEQHPLHHSSGADANVDAPPEPSMPVLTPPR
jgi:hypothetical protein